MDVTKWLGNLSKKYMSGISHEIKEDNILEKANCVLKKVGFYSPDVPKSKHKKKKGAFFSSVVIEPRGNEPKYDIANKDIIEISPKIQPKIDENEKPVEVIIPEPFLPEKKKVISNKTKKKCKLSIEETPNLSISLPVDIPQAKKPNNAIDKVIDRANEEIPERKTIQIKPKKEEKKKINEMVVKPVLPKKRDFTVQIRKLYLIKMLDMFSVWQEKALIAKRKRFTIEILWKLRTKRNSFKLWRNRFDERELKRKQYEDDIKNHLYTAKLQRMQHVAKVKLNILHKKIAFDKWFKSMKKPKTKKNEVRGVPVYKRPPDPLPPKKQVSPVKIDPRAEELIQRTKEAKEKKLQEAKQRIIEDKKEKMRIAREEKARADSIRAQHKKELEREHEKRIKKEEEAKIAQKQFEIMKKRKKEYEALLERAKLFRNKHLFKCYHNILSLKKEREENAFKHYNKHLKKNVFVAFTEIVLVKEKMLSEQAQKHRNNILKRIVLKKLRNNVLVVQKEIKDAQKVIGTHAIHSCFIEWKSAFIESIRAKDFKAIQFHDSHLIKKAFKAFPIGVNHFKEEEERKRKRDQLMAKALQYLNENQLKKTSEFEATVLKPDDIIIEGGNESMEEEEEEENYSDIF